MIKWERKNPRSKDLLLVNPQNVDRQKIEYLFNQLFLDFEEIKQNIKKYHKDHEFVSFFGYEYGSWYSGYGDICIYNVDDKIPVFRSDLNKFNSTRKLIRNLIILGSIIGMNLKLHMICLRYKI